MNKPYRIVLESWKAWETKYVSEIFKAMEEQKVKSVIDRFGQPLVEGGKLTAYGQRTKDAYGY